MHGIQHQVVVGTKAYTVNWKSFEEKAFWTWIPSRIVFRPTVSIKVVDIQNKSVGLIQMVPFCYERLLRRIIARIKYSSSA